MIKCYVYSEVKGLIQFKHVYIQTDILLVKLLLYELVEK